MDVLWRTSTFRLESQSPLQNSLAVLLNQMSSMQWLWSSLDIPQLRLKNSINLYYGNQILQVLHLNNQKNKYFHWPRVELFNRKACMVKWQSYPSHCTFFKLCSLVPTSFIYTVSISLVHSHRTCCCEDFTFYTLPYIVMHITGLLQSFVWSPGGGRPPMAKGNKWSHHRYGPIQGQSTVP